MVFENPFYKLINISKGKLATTVAFKNSKSFCFFLEGKIKVEITSGLFKRIEILKNSFFLGKVGNGAEEPKQS